MQDLDNVENLEHAEADNDFFIINHKKKLANGEIAVYHYQKQRSHGKRGRKPKEYTKVQLHKLIALISNDNICKVVDFIKQLQPVMEVV